MEKKFRKGSPFHSKTRKTLAGRLATVLAKVLHQETASTRGPATGLMQLYTRTGGRKYLDSAERKRFESAAQTTPDDIRVFCLLLMWSGCRISEALAVTPLAINCEAATVALITLKRRRLCVREVPLPPRVIDELRCVFDLPNRVRDDRLAGSPLWVWTRSTAWRYVKNVMRRADISGAAAMPKGLRHGFGVAAFQTVPPHIVQRWLGHASLRTTAIYGDVSGHEERLFAERLWRY